MRIKLVLNGKEYVASYDQLANMTIGEIRTIKRETGLTITGLHAKMLSVKDNDTVDDMDLYGSLVYLLMSKSGEPVTWADVEAIPVVDLAAGLSVLPDESPTEQQDTPVEQPAAVNG